MPKVKPLIPAKTKVQQEREEIRSLIKENSLIKQRFAESASSIDDEEEEFDIEAAPLEQLDLIKLHSNKSGYPVARKLEAVLAYVMTGNSKEASRLCGVKPDIIRAWKARAIWWPEAYEAVKKQKQEELDGRLTGVIDVLVGEVEERLVFGDEHVLSSGKVLRKKVSAKDMALIFSTLFDKRAMVRGDPTTRTEKISTEETLNSLANKFKEFSKKFEEVKIVDGEVEYGDT